MTKSIRTMRTIYATAAELLMRHKAAHQFPVGLDVICSYVFPDKPDLGTTLYNAIVNKRVIINNPTTPADITQYNINKMIKPCYITILHILPIDFDEVLLRIVSENGDTSRHQRFKLIVPYQLAEQIDDWHQRALVIEHQISEASFYVLRFCEFYKIHQPMEDSANLDTYKYHLALAYNEWPDLFKATVAKTGWLNTIKRVPIKNTRLYTRQRLERHLHPCSFNMADVSQMLASALLLPDNTDPTVSIWI